MVMSRYLRRVSRSLCAVSIPALIVLGGTVPRPAGAHTLWYTHANLAPRAPRAPTADAAGTSPHAVGARV